MRRREFFKVLGGAAAAWPLATRAQQVERVRRIAVLSGTAQTGQNPASYGAFLRRLGELGWTDGRNVRIELRWANGDPELMRSYGIELTGQSPDVFLVQSNPALAILRPLAGNTPIVFVNVADPVGSGFVANLARPGGNITGFTNFEPSMGSKWLQTLKQLAPVSIMPLSSFIPRPLPILRSGTKPKRPRRNWGSSWRRQRCTMPLKSNARSLPSQPNPTGASTYILTLSPRFIFDSLSNSRPSTGCRRCSRFAITPKRADCCRMELILWIWCLARLTMSTALCVVPIQGNCRFRRQLNSSS